MILAADLCEWALVVVLWVKVLCRGISTQLWDSSFLQAAVEDRALGGGGKYGVVVT